jgi:hypothetical protein
VTAEDTRRRVDNDNSGPARRGTTCADGRARQLPRALGGFLLIDPVFSDRLVAVRRLVAPGLSWAALPKIDAVLVTHNHRDHMDAPTLARLGESVRFIVPVGLGQWFRKAGRRDVVELEWFAHHDLGDARITFVPSQHWSMRTPFDRNESLWGGFVVEDGAHRVYHSGDTALLRRLFRGEIREEGRQDRRRERLIGAYEPAGSARPAHEPRRRRPPSSIRRRALRRDALGHLPDDEPTGEPPLFTRERWHDARMEEAPAIPSVGETLWLADGRLVMRRPSEGAPRRSCWGSSCSRTRRRPSPLRRPERCRRWPGRG